MKKLWRIQHFFFSLSLSLMFLSLFISLSPGLPVPKINLSPKSQIFKWKFVKITSLKFRISYDILSFAQICPKHALKWTIWTFCFKKWIISITIYLWQIVLKRPNGNPFSCSYSLSRSFLFLLSFSLSLFLSNKLLFISLSLSPISFTILLILAK